MKVRFMAWMLAIVALAGPALPGARADQPVGCAWPAKLDVDTLNAAFPDRNATYWMTRFEAIPGTHLEITGRYPHARYFSFHVYDEAQHPVDSIADLQIAPAAGVNRFQAGEGEGTYAVLVSPDATPPVRAPNTIYGGQTDIGTPNPSGFLLYRVYVPDDATDPAGSTPLPDVTFVSSNGSVTLSFARCTPLPPSTGGAINDVIKNSSFPDQFPRVIPWVPATDPPKFVRFYSTEGAVLDRFGDNPVTPVVPQSKGGYLSNQHIAYLYALLSRSYGDVFVFRARAPRAPDTRNAHDPPTLPADVRYWSICENELATQRFIECKADFESAIAPDGTMTFVVSDPDDRPANATAENSVNWLPWGDFYDGNVIYRHMLPSATFAHAIQNVPHGTPAGTVMGEYFPVAAYCTKQRFEQGGASACLASASS